MLLLTMQAVTKVLNKSHDGNSYLQMRQNPVTVAEHSCNEFKSLDSQKVDYHVLGTLQRFAAEFQWNYSEITVI